MNHIFRNGLLVALVVIILDQLSKLWASSARLCPAGANLARL